MNEDYLLLFQETFQKHQIVIIQKHIPWLGDFNKAYISIPYSLTKTELKRLTKRLSCEVRVEIPRFDAKHVYLSCITEIGDTIVDPLLADCHQLVNELSSKHKDVVIVD